MIRGLVGLPGQGKTLAMARWAQVDMSKGLPVAANFPMAGADYLADFTGILEWCSGHPNGVLYVDEAGIVLNSRNWQRIPFAIQALFMQHRHFGLDLIWAAQRFDHIDRSIRDLSQYVTRVRKAFPGWPTAPRKGDGYAFVPIFQAITYEMPNTRKAAWSENYWYDSRWAEMFETGHVMGEDKSNKDALDWAMGRFEDAGRAVKNAEGLRIR